MDARKNAISMVAQANFSHKALFEKEQRDMLAMLAEKGIEFDALPACFRRGSFIRHEAIERMLTNDELARIPEKHRPTGPVMRSDVKVLDVPPFNEVSNRVAVIFDGENPVTQTPQISR